MVRWSFTELDTVGSTQEVAREHAAKGAPEGTTIVAKAQTSGTGRLGRTWVSPVGGLYMSFILRPNGLSRPELITLVAAAAAVEGIKGATGLEPKIRWPNDLTLRTRKLGGIIAEASSLGSEVDWVVVGVGLNCNAPPPKMAGVEAESTSIGQELGKEVVIRDIMSSILASFAALYERWKSGEDLQEEWASRVGTIGKEVSIKLKTEENPFACVAEDIDAEGNLVVSFEGESIAVSARDLEWLRERC
ncbi:MAG: biotin--[acetyl-CoA-carboxylase] ligase [Nitrososphaerota archaeon]|jgi:BirA family biotin operon repressor/biotin-[acetyl-CoA-carboxylase] ligase|nr:biotin--[acetyl-CoA-carboxylase] ligase [Nitrososphaerota archaeon]